MKDLSVDVSLATTSDEVARSMCSRKPASNARRADAGCSPEGLVRVSEDQVAGVLVA